jgi:hypothetical protein
MTSINEQGYNNPNSSLRADRGVVDFDEPPQKDPRLENLWEMFKFTLCPKLSWTSFCTVVVLLNSLVFVAQLVMDGILWDKSFLEAPGSGKFIGAFGCTLESVRSKKQYYRLFTALLFHGNFSHIFNNNLSIIIWGSLVERLIGRMNISIIYVVSGTARYDLRRFGQSLRELILHGCNARRRRLHSDLFVLRGSDRHPRAQLVQIRTE